MSIRRSDSLPVQAECSDSECQCQSEPGVSRRGFLAAASVGAVGSVAASSSLPVMAGPFVAADFDELVPADKKLTESWLASLRERGSPDVLTGDELQYIGMPIGGIGCGQLYLGGDGRLWLWDIFKSNYRREPDHGRRIDAFTLGGHYANPVAFGEQYTRHNGADVQQGFAVRINDGEKTTLKSLDHRGFPGVTFRGEYPIGKVTYEDDAIPIKVELEAFSPFIPLRAKDSGLPASVMSFTVTNRSDEPLEVDLVGWLQNATCPYVADASLGQRRNRLLLAKQQVTLLESVEPLPKLAEKAAATQEDILFADFETDRYVGWSASGDAFQPGPYQVADLPDYVTLDGYQGNGVVNSHSIRHLEDSAGLDSSKLVGPGDQITGTLTSDPFAINRRYIRFLISGGDHEAKTCLNLIVDGNVVASQAGRNDHQMRLETFDVGKFAGKEARLQVVDSVAGGWGNICVDQIVFTDRPPAAIKIEDRHGYGSMALSLINAADAVAVLGAADVPLDARVDEIFSAMEQLSEIGGEHDRDAVGLTKPLDAPLIGALGASLSLEPGASKRLDFAITWYFPDYQEVDRAPGFLSKLQGFRNLRRHYAPRFNSAADVATYLSVNRERLLGGTRTWNRTWYDSSLPHWFLDRTFISIDCAATQMLHWFDSGRLYGWEGVDCCPGTCTHVWHYAQALGRIFPELERSFREMTDYGVAFHEDSGLIGYRAESHDSEATDGQAGTVLRVYREHQMSSDDAFLRRLWPKIKKSVQFLIAKDPERKGLLEGAQPHTLDAAWYGPMAWVSGLYLAAVAAGSAMADEMGDDAFALQCRQIAERGRHNMVSVLFDGEYFVHRPDPNMPKALRTGKGCHIDQVLGQAWAHQVGLERVIPKDETVSALKSLWRYNFAPDAAGYAVAHREIEQAFRWYAMPGEAGLLMCTWPKGGATDAIPGDRLRSAKNPDVWTGPGGYFNECMNGFEYQVAAHMIYEGAADSDLVEKGLAITRAIHERYSPSKRNPYNEIECSDHYARSMASYGVFLAACGFEYHGPQGRIGFAPRISPEDFRAPFTCAEAWGTFSQQRDDLSQHANIDLKWGQLRLQHVALTVPESRNIARCEAKVGDDLQAVSFKQEKDRVEVTFEESLLLSAGSALRIQLI